MKYRKGYKYQLAANEVYDTGILGYDINTEFIKLNQTGYLVIRDGYAWDGPSGPTIDTKSSMRGSLIHDALYQLMRMELLPRIWRKRADEIIYDCLIEDGMWKWRAKLWKRELEKWAASAADPKNRKKVYEAP